MKATQLTQVLLGLFLVSLLFGGCHTEKDIYKEHYISGFVTSVTFLEVVPYTKGKMFRLSAAYNRLEGGKQSTRIGANSTGEDLERYKKLCLKYGDTGFNRDVKTYDEDYYSMQRTVFFSEKVKGIQVKSLENWGEGYPSGTNLNDQFLFFSASPDKYIQQGYRLEKGYFERFEEEMDPRFKGPYSLLVSGLNYTCLPFIETLSDVDFSNYALLGFNRKLGYFAPVNPNLSLSGKSIEIEVLFENGEVGVVQYTFE